MPFTTFTMRLAALNGKGGVPLVLPTSDVRDGLRRPPPGSQIARIPTVIYISARRSRNALPMTDTELRLMAAAAMMGLSKRPNTG